MKDETDLSIHRKAGLATPTALGIDARRDITAELNTLLADTFALYLKTKNFHWHLSGPHFRDFHLLFDEQANQLFSTTDAIAERVRKLGGTTLRSTGHIVKLQRILDNEAEFVSPHAMLAELRDDNTQFLSYMRATHSMCDELGDVASTSLLEQWIDDAEQRIWFLFESGRGSE